jgi:hypothetical protein
LINYWTFNNNNLTDVIGGATLYNNVNTAFTSDRKNVASSALSITNGYIQVPSGTYFTGGSYTVMAWVYPRAFNSWSRIFEFSNFAFGVGSDNLIFSFTQSTSGQTVQTFYRGTSSSASLTSTSTSTLQLNQWQHVAFTFVSSTLTAYNYVNGVLTGTALASALPNNLVRSRNWIGCSNLYSVLDPYANAIYDEMKVFTVALSQSQILSEMNNSYCK